MIVYHLGQTRFARQLTGEGARLFGGRWNKIGQACIYTSEARSLCVLEYAANTSLYEIANDLAMTAYEIPDGHWQTFMPKQLPEEWMELKVPSSTQEWGNKQLQNNLALRLPSAIIPHEFNIILNPLHHDFKKVHIKEVASFTFDRRIKI